MKIEEVTLSSLCKHEAKDRRLTREEQEQLESVIGSLAWIARVCRIELLVRVSKLQQEKRTATRATAHACNQVVRYAKEHSDRGLVFRSGVIDWDSEVVIGTVADASHADEKDEHIGGTLQEPGGQVEHTGVTWSSTR